MSLNKTMRKMNCYIDIEAFIELRCKNLDKRKNKLNFRELLFKRQKGICKSCGNSLLDTSLTLKDLEIHHVKSISEARSESVIKHKLSNELSNLELLHKECHKIITYENKF